jgi:hypothetical protein
MANNFRITGNYYISKGGHDSNNGLNDDSPKKSFTRYGAGLHVAGAGVYTLGTTPDSAIGDGLTIIDMQNVDKGLIFGGQYRNLIFQNGGSFNMSRALLEDCVIRDINVITGDGRSSSQGKNRVVFFNCHSSTFFPLAFADKCIVINSNLFFGGQASPYVRNTYINFSSQITKTELYDFPPTVFSNNNIQGLIILGGIKYAIQDQFTGTPQDNGYAAEVYWLNETNLTANGYTGTITGWNTAVATCINRDPKFNNASKLDFTLQADSPHIGRALDGFSNIGGTEYAQSFYAGVSNPNILLFEVSESIDTTTNNNDWRLKAGENEGWIRAVIKVANNDVQISKIPYIGNYAFNSDAIGGSSTNMNVPDSKPVTNEYPSYLQTTAQAGNDTTLIIENHGASLGQWLWVDGQYREITGVPDANTITFADSLRAIVVVGTLVKIGAKSSLAALNPNRLNMKMRSSKAIITTENLNEPLIWDNDDLAPADTYLAQEWNNAPMIDNLNEVGFGDDDYDANYGNPINLKTVDIVIYLRNDYKS